MNRISIFLVVLTVLSACKEISFREPQPRDKKRLAEVPKILHGKYLTYDDDGELSKDTIIITASGYRFGYFLPEEKLKGSVEYDKGVLNDSLVLKSFKGYYFLNFKENPEWLLRVLRPSKNGDLLYMTPEQKDVDFKDYIRKLSAEIPVDSFESNEKMLYQIDPSPNELVDLIDKGFFTQTVLKKIQPAKKN